MRSQSQLNLTQTRYRILYDDGVVVLEIKRDIRAEGCTLTEHIQMLEGKVTLYNVQLILLDRHCVSNMENRLLLGEVTAALENQFVSRRTHFHRFSQGEHITDNLLEVCRGHRNCRLEGDRRNLNRMNIQLNQVEVILGRLLVLTIQRCDAKTRGVLLLHAQNEGLIIADRLNELEKINHVKTKDQALRAIELLKPLGMKA